MSATSVISSTASVTPSLAALTSVGAPATPELALTQEYLAANPRAAYAAGDGDPIAARRAADVPDAVNVPKYRAYAAGRHANKLTAKQRTALEGLLGHDFCDNVCAQIVGIAAARVELERFDVASEPVTDPDTGRPLPDPHEAYLDELRVKNRLDAMQAQISDAVFRDGNHYIAIDWKADSARSLWMHEPAWDGNQGMHLFYDERGIPCAAVKEWEAPESLAPEFTGVAGAVRQFLAESDAGMHAGEMGGGDVVRWRTVYLPHEIRAYRLRESVWEPHRSFRNLGTDEAPDWVADPWPLPWVDLQGRPLGIPVFHFPNASRTGRPHGDSELSGGVLGVQDQINDAHWDLTSAGRYTGYQRTWSAGVDLTDPNTGLPAEIDTSPGAHQGFIAPDARMGVIDAGDCSQLIAIIREKRDTACRMTSTPAHLVTVGSNTTGEAILRAEAPLENKTKKVANQLAPAYASAAHFSIVLANAKGATDLSEDVLIQAVMAPTAKRDPLTVAEQAAKVAPYVDEATVLEMLGFTPNRVIESMANRRAEAQERAALLAPAREAALGERALEDALTDTDNDDTVR